MKLLQICLIAIGICISVLARAQTTSPPAQPASVYFYYCPNTNSYYPAVQACPSGWIAVPAGPSVPLVQIIEPPRATEETVQSRPNAISVEVLGRALFYSLDFDRAISKHITLGVGFSSWESRDWWRDYQASVTVVPVYANYYFTEQPMRGFISVGLDWISVSSAGYDNDTFANNGFAAVVGGGWEVMDPSGFLLRLGGYIISGRTTTLSPTFALGFAF